MLLHNFPIKIAIALIDYLAVIAVALIRFRMSRQQPQSQVWRME
jgi:hypothetical protein